MALFLLFHIVVALSSIAFAGALYIWPSRKLLGLSYGALFLTTATGVMLIVGMSGDVLGTCLFGLGFVGVVLLGILEGQKKLARARVRARANE